MLLNQKHLDAIEELMKGENISNIAKKLKVSRASIYNWLDDEEFKRELDKRKQVISRNALNRVNIKVNEYLEGIEKIAKTTDNDNTALTAYGMLLDRALGKATAKQEIELSNTDNNTDVDLDSLLEDKDSNVIDLDKIAK
jgi:transposase